MNHSTETWLPVVGYEPFYSVSSQSRVYSHYKKRVLKPQLVRDYLSVLLYGREKKLCVRIHKLVAEAFIGPRPPGMHINHKDANKLHNWDSNLEYVTPSQNMQHAIAHGLLNPRRGEDNHNAKLTEVQVKQIRKARADGEKYRDIAKRFDISLGHAYQVANRQKRAVS